MARYGDARSSQFQYNIYLRDFKNKKIIRRPLDAAVAAGPAKTVSRSHG